MRLFKGMSMRLKAAAVVTAAVLGIGLWIPATAAADDIWNPFLFIPYCSTCGPQVPLTFEQVDAREILPSGSLPGGPQLSPPVPFDDGVIVIPAGPPAGGGGPNGGAPPVQVPQTGGPGGNGGNGNNGNNSGGNKGGGDGDGLDYSITVHPPGGPDGPHGPNGSPGGDSNGNPPTFGLGDGPGGGIDTITTNGPYDGGHEGQTLVPEPATLLLLGTGLSTAAFRRRRGRRIAK